MNTNEYANSLFEQPWWLDIVAKDKWHELLVKNDDGDIEGRMIIVEDKHKVFMPPFTQTLGIWIISSAKYDYGHKKRIMQSFIDQLSQYKEVIIDLSPENDYVLPFKWNGYMLEPRFTYRINDLSDIDGLYSRFNKTAKKNIKYAKNKLHIITNTDLEALKNLLNKTFENQHRKNPMSIDIVEEIVKACDANNHGQFLGAVDDDGNVHSCAYFVYDEKVCYYLFGATDPQFRSSGAQSLVLWEGIKFAASCSQIFDFEGSMIEGIENFFRQFACVSNVYYEVRKCYMLKELKLLFKPKIKKILGYK